MKPSHIKKGRDGETNTCAIALALTEQFGLDAKQVRANKDGYDEYADYVYVTEDKIEIRKTNGFSFKLIWSKLPQSVGRFINVFDEDKKKAKPFAFHLPFVGAKK